MTFQRIDEAEQHGSWHGSSTHIDCGRHKTAELRTMYLTWPNAHEDRSELLVVFSEAGGSVLLCHG